MAATRICAVEGCGKPVESKGYCVAHSRRFTRHGSPLGGIYRADNSGPCAADDCNKKATLHGYCRNHAHRFKKYGDPLAGPTFSGEPKAWLEAHVGHDSDDCLIWPFYRNDNGYGRLYGGRSRQVYAHRIMCALSHGEPPSSTYEAAHSCGRGHEGCVNPRHLRWDTTQGNADDRVLHGTENKGERNGHARLTEPQVLEICRLVLSTSERVIASRYGISRQAVNDIKNGRRWGWLTARSRSRAS